MIALRTSSQKEPEVFTARIIVYTRAVPSRGVMDQDLPSFETMPPEMPV